MSCSNRQMSVRPPNGWADQSINLSKQLPLFIFLNCNFLCDPRSIVTYILAYKPWSAAAATRAAAAAAATGTGAGARAGAGAGARAGPIAAAATAAWIWTAAPLLMQMCVLHAASCACRRGIIRVVQPCSPSAVLYMQHVKVRSDRVWLMRHAHARRCCTAPLPVIRTSRQACMLWLVWGGLVRRRTHAVHTHGMWHVCHVCHDRHVCTCVPRAPQIRRVEDDAAFAAQVRAWQLHVAHAAAAIGIGIVTPGCGPGWVRGPSLCCMGWAARPAPQMSCECCTCSAACLLAPIRGFRYASV